MGNKWKFLFCSNIFVKFFFSQPILARGFILKKKNPFLAYFFGEKMVTNRGITSHLKKKINNRHNKK